MERTKARAPIASTRKFHFLDTHEIMERSRQVGPIEQKARFDISPARARVSHGYFSP
jgi:hypothetical protein